MLFVSDFRRFPKPSHLHPAKYSKTSVQVISAPDNQGTALTQYDSASLSHTDFYIAMQHEASAKKNFVFLTTIVRGYKAA